jgi:hypothetical protein
VAVGTEVDEEFIVKHCLGGDVCEGGEVIGGGSAYTHIQLSIVHRVLRRVLGRVRRREKSKESSGCG